MMLTNKEAIEMIASMGRYLSRGKSMWQAEPIKEATDMAIKALQQTAWIPVGERLPDKDGWYLVTVQGYESVTDVSLYSVDGSAWGDVSTKQKVTAWMPLPEPYKGGDNE